MEQTEHVPAAPLNEALTYSASVMCVDLGRIEAELKSLEAAGCDELHFDVMDGQFVPNYTLGFDFIKMAKRVCGLPCSAHLMVMYPEPHIERFVQTGCSAISLHVETGGHLHRMLAQIRGLGASPGIVINAATPLTKLDYLLDCVDRVTVMTSDPGFMGGRLIPSAYERVRILRENIRHRKLNVRIEVEGHLDLHSAALLANMGAEIIVLGTPGVFEGGNAGEACAAFKAALPAQRHLV